MRLVANGTTGRPELVAEEDLPEASVEMDFRREVSETGGKDLFERQKDIDYLDIPSFLRTQAD